MSMEVEYTWLLNDSPIKNGWKSFIIYAGQPGTYQCMVKVGNDNERKTDPIEIVKVRETVISKEKDLSKRITGT